MATPSKSSGTLAVATRNPPTRQSISPSPKRRSSRRPKPRSRQQPAETQQSRHALVQTGGFRRRRRVSMEETMPTANERRRTLRRLMEAPGIVVAPSAHDALTAMLVADAGFPAVHVSGSGVARSFGFADVGLVTATEMVAVHER